MPSQRSNSLRVRVLASAAGFLVFLLARAILQQPSLSVDALVEAGLVAGIAFWVMRSL
jgi:hypothetical protein